MEEVKEDNFIKKQFLERLKELKILNLPKDQYIIWGSGVLAIRGIREARDIDIIVSKNCWKNLVKKHSAQGDKLNLIKIGDIEIWNDCMNLTDIIDQMILDKDLIEGYPFMKLIYTVEWKRFLNREKDLVDISIIEDFLLLKSLDKKQEEKFTKSLKKANLKYSKALKRLAK